ncbi:hypothetical protein [Sporosarcina sp. FSL W7-1283]|uniref:hypothetical protein n=1 Tax=Sporosarcina sp. FSL W7-1283 TaxID=2921560 RepID=UPI0030F82CCB
MREKHPMEEKFIEIFNKLDHIPTTEEETKRYYIYYKEDMREFLEWIEEFEGLVSMFGLKLPWELDK